MDAEREELARERQRRIAKLLYPHDTVLDDSIGKARSCEAWLEAEGKFRIKGADKLLDRYNRVNFAFLFQLLWRLRSMVRGAGHGERRLCLACSSPVAR